MIRPESRYARGSLTSVPYGSKSRVIVNRRFPSASRVSSVRTVEVTWVDGMRLDLLASQSMGDPTVWWKILDLNPLIQNPSDLKPGMIIRVPGV